MFAKIIGARCVLLAGVLACGMTNASAQTPPAATAKSVLPTPKPPVPATSVPAASVPAKPAPVAGIAVASTLLSAKDRQTLNQAVAAALKRQWPAARAAAAQSREPLVAKIIEWAYLREPGPHAGFSERTAFVAANPGWPSLEGIRRQAEENIGGQSASELIAWFKAYPPASTDGRVAYARALLATGNTEEAHKLAREAWLNGSFDKTEEQRFLREFGGILNTDDHWARIDRNLYDEQTTAAERILPLVSEDRAAVAKARIALMTGKGNFDALVRAVPAALSEDPGLLYDRIRWRLGRDDDAGAAALLPAFSSGGPRPDLWWRLRANLARAALAQGRITDAYSIAKHHGAIDPVSVSEAEWLAGWIALRFLKDGEASLPHFEKVYDSVQTPPSLSRGAYWTGRAIEHLGRPDLAAEWYGRAAAFVTTYYGQLALVRLKADSIPQLPSDPAPTPEERATFDSKELTRALRAVLEVNAKPYQAAFANALAASSGFAAERQLTAELVNRYGRPDLGVALARNAAREKITLVQYGYPVPGYSYPSVPEKALVLAIARQESNFDPGAVSSAGARGLMQLMPPTATALARRAKVKFSRDKLTSDPAFNLQLGSTYLNSLVEDFDGSYVMAAAAYNAGPSRPRQWMRQFGNPREPGVDIIDWVEMIPFSETRNYVQRVMENVMVYRAVLTGTPKIAQNLETELVRPQPGTNSAGGP